MLFSTHKNAYLSENGGLRSSDSSSTFVASALIVSPKQVPPLAKLVAELRLKEQDGAELDAPDLGHGKRFRILKKLLPESFQLVYVLVKKTQIYSNSQFLEEEELLDSINSLLFSGLARSFDSLQIIFSGRGPREFQTAFRSHVQGYGGSLFNPYQIRREKPEEAELLQLSRFLAGTIALAYQPAAPKYHGAYLHFLRDKIASQEIFPRQHEDFYLKQAAGSRNFDLRIAQWCLREAIAYVRAHEQSPALEELNRLIVLDRLLFQLQIDPSKYLGTGELRALIKNISGDDYSDQQFRSNVIAPLRDAGVLISSSSKGYKIPLNLEEIYSYSRYTLQMVYPLLERLGKCRESVLKATDGELDILSDSEYWRLQAYFRQDSPEKKEQH